jgi:hypothetical protein
MLQQSCLSGDGDATGRRRGWGTGRLLIFAQTHEGAPSKVRIILRFAP